MTFLQVHAQTLLTHRKTYRLARCLGGAGQDRFAVVGRLLALWSWSTDNAPDGCLGEPEQIADLITDVCGWAGDPAQLVDALVESGFVDRDAETGSLWLHDWDEHMAPLIERRRANAERMRQARANARNAREPEREPERDGGRAQRVAPAAAAPPRTREQHVAGVPSGDAPPSLPAEDAHAQHVAASEETSADARARHVRNTCSARVALEKSREEKSKTEGERDPLRGHVAAAADAATGDVIPAPSPATVESVTSAVPAPADAGDEAESESGAGPRPKASSAMFGEGSEELRLARRLRAGILRNKSDAKVPRDTPAALSGWARELDLMIRVDKRAPPDIERVMTYALGSSFWRRVLFSARQLRDKFDTIDAQAQEDERHGRAKLQSQSQSQSHGQGERQERQGRGRAASSRAGLRSLEGRGIPTGDRGASGPAVGTREYYEAAARRAGADLGPPREVAS